MANTILGKKKTNSKPFKATYKGFNLAIWAKSRSQARQMAVEHFKLKVKHLDDLTVESTSSTFSDCMNDV